MIFSTNRVMCLKKHMDNWICWIVIYFTRGHIDTYLWWNKSPNCWILFFTCFTNSSQSSLWNTSKLQERLLESLLISTLQILGNSRWCPIEMAYFERTLKNYTYVHSLYLSFYLTNVGVFVNTSRDSLTIKYMWSLKDLIC